VARKKYPWEGKEMIPNKSKTELLVNVPITEVKPYADNPFDHRANVKDIANSIISFGFSKVSIGIDEEGVMLYGHGTLEAIKLIGWNVIPTVLRISGLSADEKIAYRIADNTTTNRSKMINDLIKKEMDKQLTFDMELFGMGSDELMAAQHSDTATGTLAEISKDFATQHGVTAKVGVKSQWLYVEYENSADFDLVKKALTITGSRELDPVKVKAAVQALIASEALPGTEELVAEVPVVATVDNSPAPAPEQVAQEITPEEQAAKDKEVFERLHANLKQPDPVFDDKGNRVNPPAEGEQCPS